MAVEHDWKGHAEREAAAILSEVGMYHGDYIPRDVQYPTVVTLMAIAWLQGTNYGSHETLTAVEDGFDGLKAALL